MEPRAWQKEFAEYAQERNIIVNAETGSGKTLVAQLAIELALRRCPGRKCAFIVSTSRLLAHQQYERIKADVLEGYVESRAVKPERVVEVTGYTAGLWGSREWEDCRGRNDVFVGTAEIFSRAFIDHGFLKLDDFALLVIDECHHVRGEAHVADILHKLHGDGDGGMRTSPGTRVLGLTASYASCRAESKEEFGESLQHLQDLMQAKVKPYRAEQHEEPTYVHVPYKESPVSDALAQSMLETILHQLELHGVKNDGSRAVRQLATILSELGRDAFLFALEHGVIAQIEAKIDNHKAMWETREVGLAMEADVEKLRAGLAEALVSVRASPELMACDATSDKASVLVAKLRDAFNAQDAEPGFCGIVFVKEVGLAMPLKNLLEKELELKVAVVSGTQSMQEMHRNAAFCAFKSGAARLLVSTACAEEGVDVAACAFVVRFSQFDTTRSHIQGVGRARRKKSTVYYFDNDPDTEKALARLMCTVAEAGLDVGRKLGSRADNRRKIHGRHPYIIPETGAEVNIKNAIAILRKYCAKVASTDVKPLHKQDQLVVPGPLGGFKITEDEVGKFLKGCSELDDKILNRMAYVVVLLLHAKRWLDSHNMPTREAEKRTIWPMLVEEIPQLVLQPGWYPPGILGGWTGQMMDCPVGRRDDSRHREHTSSGSEQQKMGTMYLDPMLIKNTQTTVNKTFSNGGSVLQAMVDLVQGKTKLCEFPLIRVSLEEGTKQWHSADNRRLFMFKVVIPLMDHSKVEVDVINWTSEFDSKNNQVPRFGDVWTTYDESIELVRKEVRQLVFDPSGRLARSCAAADTNPVSQMVHSHAQDLFRNLANEELGQTPGLDQEALASATAVARAQRIQMVATKAQTVGTVSDIPARPTLQPGGSSDFAEQIEEEEHAQSDERHNISSSQPEEQCTETGGHAEGESGQGDSFASGIEKLKLSLATVGGLRFSHPAKATEGSEAARAFPHPAIATEEQPVLASPAAYARAAPVSSATERSAGGVDVADALRNALHPSAGHGSVAPGYEAARTPGQNVVVSPPTTCPASLARPRPHAPDNDELLQRISRDLYRALGDPASLGNSVDVVSQLNLAVMGHYRPAADEVMPLQYDDVSAGCGFTMMVTVCGRSYVGADGCNSKKEAKRSAAFVAVQALLEEAANTQSSDGFRRSTTVSANTASEQVVRAPAQGVASGPSAETADVWTPGRAVTSIGSTVLNSGREEQSPEGPRDDICRNESISNSDTLCGTTHARSGSGEMPTEADAKNESAAFDLRSHSVSDASTIGTHTADALTASKSIGSVGDVGTESCDPPPSEDVDLRQLGVRSRSPVPDANPAFARGGVSCASSSTGLHTSADQSVLEDTAALEPIRGIQTGGGVPEFLTESVGHPNPVSRLNERMMALLGRPLVRGDVEYAHTQTSPTAFAATVTLHAWAGGTASVPTEFTGDVCQNKKKADRSAAERALHAIQEHYRQRFVAKAKDPAAIGKDRGNEHSGSGVEEAEPEHVCSPCRCQEVCEQLLQNDMVAVDIEGVNLGRNGEICIVQVAVRSGQVFLFDVVGLGLNAFQHGLKTLMESCSVAKLFYDCRADADALFHLHGIRPNNILDLQVLCVKATCKNSRYLPSMVTALGHILPDSKLQQLKNIKLAAGALFAPDKGGSYEVWRRRPLLDALKTYCANDVVHLFAMLDSWQCSLSFASLRAMSEERMNKRMYTDKVEEGAQLALVDFPFLAIGAPQESAPKRPRTNSEAVASSREELCADGCSDIPAETCPTRENPEQDEVINAGSSDALQLTQEAAAPSADSASPPSAKLAKVELEVPSDTSNNVNATDLHVEHSQSHPQSAKSNACTGASNSARSVESRCPRGAATAGITTVSQGTSSATPLHTGAANAVTTTSIRAWIADRGLPSELADRLEGEDIFDCQDLVELTDQDLDGLCTGLKLGAKISFKREVRAISTPAR